MTDTVNLCVMPGASSTSERGPEPIHHELKSWPRVYRAIVAHLKTADLRYDDRGFREGDTVHFREYDPHVPEPGDQPMGYTGSESEEYRITHIQRGNRYGLLDGYVMLSLVPVSTSTTTPVRVTPGRHEGPVWRVGTKVPNNIKAQHGDYPDRRAPSAGGDPQIGMFVTADDARRAVEAVNLVRDGLMGETDVLREQLAGARADLTETGGLLYYARAELAEAQAEIKRLRSEVHREAQAHAARQAELRRERDSARETVAEANSLLRDLNNEINALRDTREELGRRHREAIEQRDELALKMGEAHMENRAADREIERLRRERDDLIAKLADRARFIESLQTQIRGTLGDLQLHRGTDETVVYYGGPDPDNCAGTIPRDCCDDAVQLARRMDATVGVGTRQVYYGPWRTVEVMGEAR